MPHFGKNKARNDPEEFQKKFLVLSSASPAEARRNLFLKLVEKADTLVFESK